MASTTAVVSDLPMHSMHASVSQTLIQLQPPLPPTLVDLLQPVPTRLIEVGRPVCTPFVQPTTVTHLLDTAVPSTCAAPMPPTFHQISGPVPTLIAGDPLHHTNPPHVTPVVTSSLTRDVNY